MKLLKQSSQVKKAIEDEELDEEEIEKEVEEEDEEREESDDEEEEQKPSRPVAPLFQKKDKAKEEKETKEDGTIEPAILPLGNGDLRPGWNIWCDGKKVFSTDELTVLITSKLFKATKQ